MHGIPRPPEVVPASSPPAPLGTSSQGSRTTPPPAGASADLEELRREPDPIRQGVRATELINECRERVEELASIRKAAVERAHREQGMTYTEVAKALGITKGRITQIRQTGPQ